MYFIAWLSSRVENFQLFFLFFGDSGNPLIGEVCRSTAAGGNCSRGNNAFSINSRKQESQTRSGPQDTFFLLFAFARAHRFQLRNSCEITYICTDTL